MALAQERIYTIDDIYALPEGQRAELIDGRMYMIAPPIRIHQKLVSQFTKIIGNYIDARHGTCEVYPAPFAVFLDEDGLNYLEPDISVICDKCKLNDRGCSGAPDWIIEITSPSNPQKNTVMVYDLENEEKSNQYTFEEDVPVCIYDDLNIRVSDLLKNVATSQLPRHDNMIC